MSLRRTGPALASIALLAGGVLSGCSSDDEPGKADSSASAIPSDFISDSASPNGEDGLPADFPREAVPLLDGNLGSVVHKTAPKEPDWTVLITVNATPAAALDDAIKKLKAEGWVAKTTVDSAGEAPQLLRNGKGVIVLKATQQSDQAGVVYSIDHVK
ncbi:hypothetical protein [Nocardioides acrostichi]|uniref:Uncharacterized protein n=1 Tax=Nocardioides acrostichi TaxID=2784339 RepID=A0A930UX72_9ACTN|nr:hypothetical protein [Nocardioides acrostichi]MBF4162523.1 hypothetical protein [Nocardioides acrostichi]